MSESRRPKPEATGSDESRHYRMGRNILNCVGRCGILRLLVEATPCPLCSPRFGVGILFYPVFSDTTESKAASSFSLAPAGLRLQFRTMLT